MNGLQVKLGIAWKPQGMVQRGLLIPCSLPEFLDSRFLGLDHFTGWLPAIPLSFLAFHGLVGISISPTTSAFSDGDQKTGSPVEWQMTRWTFLRPGQRI